MDEREKQQEAYDLAQIRQRPSRLNAKKIGVSVRRLMTRSGYGQTQAASDLQTSWSQAAGEQISKRSRPGNISRGVLTIHVADSPTMQEIYFQKRQLLKKLQQAMPEVKLKDLRTRISKF